MTQVATIVDGVRTGYSSYDVHEVLRMRPGVLLGVSDVAEKTLADLGLGTVFDLACSRVFATAKSLLEAGDNPRSTLAQAGVAPQDIVAPGSPLRVEDLRFESIKVLKDLSGPLGDQVAKDLGVATVRDLALWPPQLVAVKLMQRAFGGEDPPPDPEAPADLLPRNGDYPTERVLYKTFVSGETLAKIEELTELGPDDVPQLLEVAAGDSGKPATGAMLTVSQSWYPIGVALGQLLHSVALAPGESTRIALIDWSRRTSASQTETGSESEDLSNSMNHGRAMSEVQNGVASEAQSGFSSTFGTSSSSQSGGGAGFSLGPFSLGGSASSGETTTQGFSTSASQGRREISAEMTQNVMDSTQQHATAVRNRRASVVKEVSQEEHEAVSTRVVANYNHMHALTVQYYEVIQIYRVRVRVEKVEPVLQIPVEPPVFEEPDDVDKALPWVDAVLIDPRTKLGPYWDAINLPRPSDVVKPDHKEVIDRGDWDKTAIAQASERLGFDLLPHGMDNLRIPPDAKVLSMELRGAKASQWQLDDASGATVDLGRASGGKMTVPASLTVRELGSLSVAGTPTEGATPMMALRISHGGKEADIEVPVALRAGEAVTPVAEFASGQANQQLLGLLKANRASFGQAVLSQMDGQQIVQSLSKFTYQGTPLSQVVDSTPLGIAGNSVLLKHYAETAHADGRKTSWGEWLEEHGLDQPAVSEDIVPLPSGGVFAEAVLGRYNAAEKLDITRFWNWQDSPPPLVAPEIAAIQTGTRATPEDTKPGSFSNPLVNIVSPSALPDPVGLGAVMTALSQGNMFRDMSGLADTIGLAKSLSDTSMAGATNAGALAADNLRVAAQKEVEMAKTAVGAMQAMMGNPNAQTGSGANISGRGALINQGHSMDQRSAPAGSSGGGAKAITGGGTPDHEGDATPDTPSHEEEAYNSALWGQAGTSGAELLSNPVFDAGAGDGGAPDGGAPDGGGATTPAVAIGPGGSIVPANITQIGPRTADALHSTWQGSAQGASTAAQRHTVIKSALGGVNLNDKTAVQPAAPPVDKTKLDVWNTNHNVNYVDHLTGLYTNAAGHTISGASTQVMIGAKAIDANDWAWTRIVLNHEFDHVRNPNGSELAVWTETFKRDFNKDWVMNWKGTEWMFDIRRSWSQLGEYYAISSQPDQTAAVASIASYYSGLSGLALQHLKFWLAYAIGQGGNQATFANAVVAKIGAATVGTLNLTTLRATTDPQLIKDAQDTTKFPAVSLAIP